MTRSSLRGTLQHIVEEMGQLRDLLLVFGMHVHVAMPDKQTTIDMMNGGPLSCRITALSTSSPFWMGRNTGLKSSHDGVSPVPRTGVPEQFESWSAVRKFRESSREAELYRQRQKIGGRAPAPMFGTLEFRMSTSRRESKSRGHRRPHAGTLSSCTPQPAQL